MRPGTFGPYEGGRRRTSKPPTRMREQASHVPQQAMLRDYAHVLWQRKWIVLLAVVIVPLVAVLLTMRMKSHWVASADVLLQPSATALVTGAPAQGLSDATLADLARVPQVAQRAIDAAHVTNRSAGQLLGESSVALKPDESILTVSVTDASPATAAVLATAYARQYVRYRHQLEIGSLESERSWRLASSGFREPMRSRPARWTACAAGSSNSARSSSCRRQTLRS